LENSFNYRISFLFAILGEEFSKMQERRRYQRFILEDNIFLKFESNPTKTMQGKLLDISFGGLSVFLKEKINVGAVVRTTVQFNAPNSAEKQLVGKGKVVHASEYRLYAQDGFRIGLEFIEVDKKVVINIINELRLKILHQIKNLKN